MTPYEEVNEIADKLTWPTADEFDQWAEANPDEFEVLMAHLRPAINLLKDVGFIEDEEDSAEG
jgi:hypothetical protein